MTAGRSTIIQEHPTPKGIWTTQNRPARFWKNWERERTWVLDDLEVGVKFKEVEIQQDILYKILKELIKWYFESIWLRKYDYNTIRNRSNLWKHCNTLALQWSFQHSKIYYNISLLNVNIINNYEEDLNEVKFLIILKALSNGWCFTSIISFPTSVELAPSLG